MSDGMTHEVATQPPATEQVQQPRSRRVPLRALLEPLLALVAFAAAGAGAGVLWEHLWEPTRGVVVDGTWYAGTRVDGDFVVSDFPALTGYFDATATFVLIGVAAGLVLGVLCGLLVRRSELVMFAAVAAGSVLACFIAYRLGVALGPVDPTVLEASADNGTVLPDRLSLAAGSPFLGWSFGALLGIGGTYFLTSGASEVRRREQHDPRWLSRSDVGSHSS